MQSTIIPSEQSTLPVTISFATLKAWSEVIDTLIARVEEVNKIKFAILASLNSSAFNKETQEYLSMGLFFFVTGVFASLNEKYMLAFIGIGLGSCFLVKSIKRYFNIGMTLNDLNFMHVMFDDTLYYFNRDIARLNQEFSEINAKQSIPELLECQQWFSEIRSSLSLHTPLDNAKSTDIKRPLISIKNCLNQLLFAKKKSVLSAQDDQRKLKRGQVDT